MLKVHLMIIDPQNDFMGEDDGSPYRVRTTNGTALAASLAVKGAVSDMTRLARMVDRIGRGSLCPWLQRTPQTASAGDIGETRCCRPASCRAHDVMG